MSINIPPLREFPNDGRRWRIDWFGAVRPNHGRGYERTIDVIISPIQNGILNPLSPSHVIDDERRLLQIGVGQLPFLKIGSIWKDRKLQDEVAGDLFKVDDIYVSPDNITVITPEHQKAPGKWTIPSYAHKVSKDELWVGLKSKCLAITYRDDPFGIIVPVAELIRFYYASSTTLAHAAINGVYKHDISSLINPDLSGYLEEEKKCSLRLRTRIADDDAWTIGRILNSPSAWNGVTLIHDSIMTQSAEGKLPYPNCGLPFQGITNWMCRGIGFTQDGHRRLLIFELEKCSASFPYDYLEVTRDNDNRGEERGEARQDKELAWCSSSLVDTAPEPSELQTGEEPHSSQQSFKIIFNRDRFAAIAGKEIIKPQKDECRYISGQLPGLLALQSQQMGTGQGCYEVGTESTAPAEVISSCTRREALPASLEILDDITRELNRCEGISARIRECVHGNYTLPRLALPRSRQWAYLDSAMRTPRRVRAIDILYQGSCFCFIEFEQRASEKKSAGLVRLTDYTSIYEVVFDRLLRLVTKTEGRWGHRSFNDSGFFTRPMRHTWSSVKTCASSIVDRIG